MRSLKTAFEGITPRRRLLAVAAAIALLTVPIWVKISRSQTPTQSPNSALALPEGMAGKVGELQITEEAMSLAEIDIAPAELRSVRESISVPGIVKADGNRQARITPQVGGEVVEILAIPGDQVDANQILARLNSPELARAQVNYRRAVSKLEVATADFTRRQGLAGLGEYGHAELETSMSRAVDAERGVFRARRSVAEKQAALAQARGNLEVLRNRLKQTEAELEVRRAHYERANSVPDAVSQQTLERLRADFKKAEADVAVAQARIGEGEANLSAAQQSLKTVKGEQPLAKRELGIRRHALAREKQVYSRGYSRSRELIEAQSNLQIAQADREAAAEEVKLLGGVPGGGSEVYLRSPIAGKVDRATLTLGENIDSEHVAFMVVDLAQVWVDLAVPPGEIGKLEVGDEVALKADSVPSQVYHGTIRSIGASSDETTRTVPVMVTVDNSEGKLTTGSYVKAMVTTQLRQERLTVPEGALQEHTGRATLYVARPENKGAFEVRHVVLGLEGDGWREISEGLEAGEPLATAGTFYLKSEALKNSLSDGCCAVGE